MGEMRVLCNIVAEDDSWGQQRDDLSFFCVSVRVRYVPNHSSQKHSLLLRERDGLVEGERGKKRENE